MVLKLEHFENCIRNTWKVLKCGTGDGWRKTVWTDRVRNEEVLNSVKKVQQYPTNNKKKEC
jgi:hypothetical protein